ncbi:MAG: lysine--tRNA ligase [Candidatus Aminicenantaceae bacterium]
MSEKRNISKEVKEGISDQESVRREKMERLAKEGVELFPHNAEIDHSIVNVVNNYSSLSKEELDEKKIRVKIAGRISSVRKMGRATFFHIIGGQSQIQIYLREDKIGKKKYDLFSLLDIGDIIAVQGGLFKTRTGELTVLADSYAFLAKCLHPLPEKWHGLQNIEIRYRRRYLDMIMNSDVKKVFILRSQIISYIRKFFDDRGFIEVETPMMHSIPGGALAKPFKTFHNALDMELYLRIAPELYLKRLIVGGFEKVYEVNRNFRNEGISSEHNPEFTMLEFYQAFSDYNDMMELTEELISSLVHEVMGKEEISFGENRISLKRPWKRMKFKEAVAHFAGISISRVEDEEEMIKLASALTSEDQHLSYGNALDVLFDKYVKQNLIQPTFILNHPKDISPLAKLSNENPEEAERFELVMGGMEIANAFSELSDPSEQRSRFEQQSKERDKGDEDAHRIDEDYIQALEYGLPPTGGEGIGIDRLVMMFANVHSIREVILFPLLRPKT